MKLKYMKIWKYKVNDAVQERYLFSYKIKILVYIICPTFLQSSMYSNFLS